MMGMKAARLYGSKIVNSVTVIDLNQFAGHASVPIPVPPDVLVYHSKLYVLEVNLKPYALYREAVTYEYGKRG